nr:MAG TPA: hypothetical protein [Caudoviricetes sp.]
MVKLWSNHFLTALKSLISLVFCSTHLKGIEPPATFLYHPSKSRIFIGFQAFRAFLAFAKLGLF